MSTLRRILVLAFLVSTAAFASAATASPAAPTSGMLVGRTLITFGCPGPARIGIACPRWYRFSHARVAIRQVGPSGQPLPQIVRLVVSDAHARFSLRLGSGDYRITPLAQSHTYGGKSVTARVEAGSTTRVTVRFVGFPQMV